VVVGFRLLCHANDAAASDQTESRRFIVGAISANASNKKRPTRSAEGVPTKAISMSTFSQKPADVTKKWVLIDAEGLVVGRLASIVANILRGKNKPTFTPHMDMGDNVIVINTDKLKVTGKKLANKLYQRHSGWPGGFCELTLGELMEKDSRKVVLQAVKGMLPKNKLSDKIIKKLKVYAGSEHPHKAQVSK